MFVFLMLCWGVSANAESPIKIDGSTGVKALVTALAAEYQKRSTTEFEFGRGLKPGARIAALQHKQIDIAMASHGIDIKHVKQQGLAVHQIARMAVVMAVHHSVKLRDISSRHLCDIYRGNITNWQDLSKPGTAGQFLPIVPLIRPFSEVDAEVFRQQVSCFKHLQIPQNIGVINKSGAMARAIARTPGAIGMSTQVRVAQSNGKMTLLAIDGIAPNVKNLLSGTYSFSRNSFLITQAQPSAQVLAFLEFIQSEFGADVIVANSAVPVQ